VPGLARAIEEEGGPDEARVGAPPAAVVDAARRAAERAAQEELSRRVAEARSRLGAHAEAEEERLVMAAFQGGAERHVVDAALAELRRHRDATDEALTRVRLELDAAALVVPA
jgi:ATP-dependent helicase HepA